MKIENPFVLIVWSRWTLVRWYRVLFDNWGRSDSPMEAWYCYFADFMPGLNRNAPLRDKDARIVEIYLRRRRFFRFVFNQISLREVPNNGSWVPSNAP